MNPSRKTGAALAALLLVLAGCSDGDDDAAVTSGAPDRTDTSTVTSTGAAGGRCLVRLHGKGGSGAGTMTEGEVTIIAPTGNSEGWGGRQWLYFPDGEYASAQRIVADSVEGCEQIVVNGFSNGASFAAVLYCRGETFDGRLVGVVADDPVPDHGADGCAPDPDVDLTLYWTGGLEATAAPGWDCTEADWTCAGGETIGIDAYAAALGADVTASPFDDHQWYVDAPETTAWRS